MPDNMEKIICPACSAEMAKVFMPEQGVNIDVCTEGCGGIYFDNREFSKFDEPNEDISPLLEVLQGKNFAPADQTQTRLCPVCGSKMVKNYTDASQSIEIDECYACGGKFLDYQELNKIRERFGAEKVTVSELVKTLYNDAGLELPETGDDAEYKWHEGWSLAAWRGAFIGLLIAVVFIIRNRDIMFMPDNAAYLSIIAMIIGICLICAAIGALIYEFFHPSLRRRYGD